MDDHAPVCVHGLIFAPSARLARSHRIEFQLAMGEHAAVSEVEGGVAERVDLDAADLVELSVVTRSFENNSLLQAEIRFPAVFVAPAPVTIMTILVIHQVPSWKQITGPLRKRKRN